jgi:predicted CoA-binding protein
MVVSPEHGKAFVEEAAELGIKYIWFQPGACNEELLNITEQPLKTDFYAVQAYKK